MMIPGRVVYSTKHCGFKSNKMQSIYFRFRIQNLWRLDQTRIYYYYHFLDSSIYVQSFEKRLTCFSQ